MNISKIETTMDVTATVHVTDAPRVDTLGGGREMQPTHVVVNGHINPDGDLWLTGMPDIRGNMIKKDGTPGKVEAKTLGTERTMPWVADVIAAVRTQLESR